MAKDETQFEHKNNIVYFCENTDGEYIVNYIREKNRRILECLQEWTKQDKNSYVLKHTRTTQYHQFLTPSDS